MLCLLTENGDQKQAVVESGADCFILPLTGAVERTRDASLCGKPMAVVQYNPRGPLDDVLPGADRRRTDGNNHSAIAVSYEAREKGNGYYVSERVAVADAIFFILFIVTPPPRQSSSFLFLFNRSHESYERS